MNKLKIALGSDVHLEFGDLEFENEQGADVLILAGDIMIAQDLHDFPEPLSEEHIKLMGYVKGSQRLNAAIRYRGFLKRCSEKFKHVIYIAGNHEFYHGKFYSSLDDLRKEALEFPNVYFLENETKIIEGVTFIGCTLWTDMNKFDPFTLWQIGSMMNDFSIIRDDRLGYTKLKPATAAERHKKSLDYIRHVTEGKPDETFVVVGHHSPSTKSIHPKYAHDTIMNGGYSSDLSELILSRPQIKLWCHGHTHFPFDYMIGETRVVCNPRGYVGYEVDEHSFKFKYMEI